MKKALFAFLGLSTFILTSCGEANLNKAIALNGCEKTFLTGTSNEGITNYLINLRIDSVIDDMTPINPDAAMIEGNKIVKICFVHENINSENPFQLDIINLCVYDTKTKKEYKPTLRDKEYEIEKFGTSFFTIDVPKDTKIENLSVGVVIGDIKDYADFIPLKNNSEGVKKNDLVKMNKEVTYESVLLGTGKVKLTIKSITYNIDDSDKIAKEIHVLKPLAKIAKVDIEYKLIEGEEADINRLAYLFTDFRIQFTSHLSQDLGYSIKGNGSTKTVSEYFVLYANENITHITDSDSSPSVVFEIKKK